MRGISCLSIVMSIIAMMLCLYWWVWIVCANKRRRKRRQALRYRGRIVGYEKQKQ